MHKSKSRLITLSVAFLVVLTVLLSKDKLLSYFSPKPVSPFASIKPEQITNLEIVNNGKVDKILKQNNHWIVKTATDEYKADEGEVNRVITNALGVKKEEIISTNKSKHSELGIGNRKVTLTANGKNQTLYIGNNANMSNQYARVNHENEVFITTGLDFITSVEDYRDLSIRPIDNEEKVTFVDLNYDAKKITLEKKGNDWVMDDKKVKAENVDFYINQIKTLKSTDILKADSVKDLLVRAAITINLKENGQDKKIEFFTKDKDSYYVKPSSQSAVFVMPTASGDALKKDEKGFME